MISTDEGSSADVISKKTAEVLKARKKAKITQEEKEITLRISEYKYEQAMIRAVELGLTFSDYIKGLVKKDIEKKLL